MLEKTLNARKKFILLRWFFSIVMVVSLALGFVLPTRAQAAAPTKPIEYTELDYSVKYGTYDNQVTVPISSDYFYFNYIDEMSAQNFPYVRGQDSYTFVLDPGRIYSLFVYPASNLGLNLTNLPAGSRLIFDLRLDISSPTGAYFAVNSFERRYFYLDNTTQWIMPVVTEPIESGFGEDFSVSFLIEDKENAKAFVPSVRVKYLETRESVPTTFTVTLRNVRLVMDIPVAFWNQFQEQQNGKMLGEIKDELGDVKDELGNVNDKLDDTNEKLEELPGEIGDEMQGVIDKENDKAESSGNKFVNQILDKLPDPSTEVLGSLKGLTDSMAYTGTDCKLKIPALVIPAIDGLIPETEIWGGTEFSFSDYLSFLPPALLTVVQSLFTIAIVLFCVYELKGIISYCLTLNDKKGG